MDPRLKVAYDEFERRQKDLEEPGPGKDGGKWTMAAKAAQRVIDLELELGIAQKEEA